MSVYTQPLEMWPERGAIQALLLGAPECMGEGLLSSGKQSNSDTPSTLLFLDARMLPGIFPVLLAINRAVAAEEKGKLRTANLSTEVLFNLSPTTNINESVEKYSVKPDDPHPILVVRIGTALENQKFEQEVRSIIQEDLTLLDVEKDLGKDVDMVALCKYFKYDPKEVQDHKDLERVIMATMALKGVSAK
ncbi:MAG: kinase binding protein CGI-121-domain-containing protein [Piptocephalis tieghemiana]|nr:MAG: kinase binding protein CGI-121-domain-containing protein [Piptocephalis tieghemiana]